mgnify:CR=1 FL=1
MKYEFQYDSENEEKFKSLVVRFAEGRKLCNCREAYEDATGGCRYGCSANKIYTKYEIASRCLKIMDAK